MDSKKFIEIKKPVEEVREIESEQEMKLETPKVEKVEVVKETSSYDNMTEEEKEFEESYKKIAGRTIGATDVACPPLGAAETVACGVGGALTEAVGKLSGDEGTEAGGRALKGAGTQAAKDVGKGVKKVGEGIKKIFD